MKLTTIISILICAAAVRADVLDTAVKQAMGELPYTRSADPYSRTIRRVIIGRDENGNPKTGIAYREIESYKPITALVIVDKTPEGYVLREAQFPDINKIRKAKDRKLVLSVLAQFKNIPFDPHAEKSAVDTLSGATRYGIKTCGYLNYMARHLALTMENPPVWSKPK